LDVSDDGTYVAHVKGPIHVENLGPVPSLDLDGTLTSAGENSLRNGQLAFKGNLTGEETIVSNSGISTVLEGDKIANVRSTILKGSKVDVNLDAVTAGIKLQLAPHQQVSDLKPVFTGM